MKPVRALRLLAISFACLAPAVGLAEKPAAKPLAADVLSDPDFRLATRSFSPSERLEFAAHVNVLLRRYEQAIPMYEALVKRRPNRPELWIMLAAAYNRVDEPREALDAASIAVTLAPHYPHFRAERGIAAFRLGEHQRALEDLQSFLKAFPASARGHYYLGLAQAAVGDVDAAQRSLMKARALNPALSLLTDYYLGLIALKRDDVGLGRQLLAETRSAFEGLDHPMSELLTRQLSAVDGALQGRLRAAIHQADVAAAPIPAR